MNVAPKARPKVKLTLKEFEEFDAPKKGFKRLFHRVFHLAMRWHIKEMLREGEMDEEELREHKRGKEMRSVRRRILFNYFYLVLAPVCALLSFKSSYESWSKGSPWGLLYLTFGIFWLRSLSRDWASAKELRRRRMELLVEEVHDL